MNRTMNHESRRPKELKEKSKKIKAILEELVPLLDAHDCTMELGEVSGNRVVIHCGGEGSVCDSKCVEEVIRQKIPGIEIIFR